MRLFFGRVSFDNTSGWINSIVQYPFLVPFSAEQFPLITHNGAVFVSSFFDGTTAIGGATFEAAKGKKTMFLTQTTSRGDWRRTNVIGAAKDVVPGGIAVRNLSPGKRVGVVARMAPKQSVWFSAPLSIEVGDKTEGFIAFTEDGVWRRAESIKGALDRWQPTALHYERQTQQWIMGGYLLGSLSLGGGQIVSDPLYGTAFLGVYDYGRASWRRLVSIPGVSDQDTRGLFTHGLRFHQTEQGGSLYMSGGNMNGKIGARDFRRAYSFFVTKNPHLIK
jgi:hypothetical protein